MKQLFVLKKDMYSLLWIFFGLVQVTTSIQAMVQKKSSGALSKKVAATPPKKGFAKKKVTFSPTTLVYVFYVQNPQVQANPAAAGYMRRKAESLAKKQGRKSGYGKPVQPGAKTLSAYLLARIPTAELLKKFYPIASARQFFFAGETVLLQPAREAWDNSGYSGPNFFPLIKDKPILFYNLKDTYGEFTNFYRAPITIDGVAWPTTEHYFQAQKFPSQPTIQEQIRKESEPRKVFDIANSFVNKWYVRSDWNQESVFLSAMYRALVAKFTQHPPLLKLLLGTEKRILVEDTAKAKREDKRWGAGKDYKGENYLGRLLMYIRDLTREFQRL